MSEDANRDWCIANGFQWMQVDPPGPNRKIRWTMPDGTIHEQDAPEPQKYLYTAPKPVYMDEARQRQIIREELRAWEQDLVKRMRMQGTPMRSSE